MAVLKQAELSAPGNEFDSDRNLRADVLL